MRYCLVSGEADFQLAKIGSSDQTEIGGWLCYGEDCSNQISWYSTLRARLSMPFVTGGFAFAHIQSMDGAGARTTDLGKMKLGWTIGGVVENAFAPNLSVKVDGLYVDLGRLSAG
ncbi:MAG: hypothetical protein COB90_05200 [Hyphomicrobiales bacterium]|nr:MAG: hypothetical protein COB90_05200 [Hyphomicrobiales bacterium]